MRRKDKAWLRSIRAKRDERAEDAWAIIDTALVAVVVVGLALSWIGLRGG